MIERLISFVFKCIYIIPYWLKSHLTKAGWLISGGLAVSALIGLDTNQAMAYQIFTFLAAILIISTAAGFFFNPRIIARRILPRFGTVGESLLYRITVENGGSRRQDDLVILDDREDRDPAAQTSTTDPIQTRKAQSLTGIFLSYRQRMMSGEKQHAFKEVPLPALPPGGVLEIPVEIMPRRRGPMRLSGLTIARNDPLGLYRSLFIVPLSQSVLILPKRYPLPPIQLPGTRRYQPGGVSLAQSVGDSEEFTSLRDYRPGDPLRRIHWRAWARTGKPIVKEYQDEYFVRHALILDTFQADETSLIFEEAVSIAASFASSILTQESLLDLMFIGTEAYCFTSGRGISHADRMLEILASVIPCQDKAFETLPPLVMNRASMLSGCICILLVWDDQRKYFIQQLKALRIPLLALVITQNKSALSLEPELADIVHAIELENVREGLAGL
jgi:uncharacterized protein (DUF58 family)